ncbi:MAG: DUF1801 domain-containing protein [Crocinitomicaceae bacterium]
METEAPTNFEDYFSKFPAETQVLLQQMRETIQRVAPDAVEIISYKMPAFKTNKILVYFAAYAKHIGFYPGASGIANFQSEISQYKNAKGSVQFPLNKPLPLDLVTRIVQFRAKENLEKQKQ